MERDPELELVICEVLSLENDYPRAYPSKRARQTPQQQTEPPAALTGASHEREDGGTLKSARPAVPSEEPSMAPGGALKRARPAVPSEPWMSAGGALKSARPAVPSEPWLGPGGALKRARPALPSEEPWLGPGGALKRARPAVPAEEPSMSPGGALRMTGPPLLPPEPSLPSSEGGCRRRTSFSTDQLALLRAAFQLNPYPDFSSRTHISEVTGVPESRVQVWFQNRRARHLRKPGKPSVSQEQRQLDQCPEQHHNQDKYHDQYQHQSQNLYQHQHQHQHQHHQASSYPAHARGRQTPDLRTPGPPLTLSTGPSPVPPQASLPQPPGLPGPGDAPAPLLRNLQEDFRCDLDFLDGWSIEPQWPPVFTFGSSRHALVLGDQLSCGP